MTESKSQSQQVYEYLKDAICNCRYLPGQEISEKQLFEELPFGRTPIRETLQQLQKEELVEIYPRRGMRIAPFTQEKVSDLYQTRKLIEPAIASTHCPMYSKEKLFTFGDSLRSAIAMGDAEYYKVDIDFHSYLVSVANNRMLTAIFTDIMWHQYRLAVFAAMQGKTQRSDNEAEHQRILNALLCEDRNEIYSSIISHINTSMITLMRSLR